jgi:hypothetical protein
MIPVVTIVPGLDSGVSAAPPAADQQLSALQAVCALLNRAAEALKEGDARVLSDVGPGLAATADGVGSLWLQAGIAGMAPGAEAERRRLLISIAEQRRFCKSMLRRWRRFIVLRQQVLGLQPNPFSYGETLCASRR